MAGNIERSDRSKTLHPVEAYAAGDEITKTQFEGWFRHLNILQPGETLPDMKMKATPDWGLVIAASCKDKRWGKELEARGQWFPVVVAHYATAIYPWRKGATKKLEGGVEICRHLLNAPRPVETARQIIRAVAIYRHEVDVDESKGKNPHQYVMAMDKWVKGLSYMEERELSECITEEATLVDKADDVLRRLRE